MSWKQLDFEDVVEARGSGTSGLPQSQWQKTGAYPVIGQGAEFIEGWSDRSDLAIRPDPAVILYGGHTRRAKYVDRPFVPGPNVRILRVGAELNEKFLFHYLAQLKIESRGYADHFPEVRRCSIPVPPLSEQHRIAAILDKADALRAKRREAIAKLDQLLQSVFLEMFGDPATNPMDLPMVSLGDLSEWRSGGTPSRSNPSFFRGDIPWYSSGELNSPYVSGSNENISADAVSSSAAKMIEPGSLMVGMYDTAAFKSSITTIPATCNQAIAFSLLDASKCDTVYVYQALQIGKEHFKRMQRGVRQKNLNLSMIRETKIPLPAVGLQRDFAKIFAAVLYQQDSQNSYAGGMGSLFGTMQRQAFAGTL